MRHAFGVATAVVALSLTTGCGGSSASDPDAGGFSAAADATTCLADATAVTSTPEGYPKDFPMPPGTVVFNVEDRGADGTIVTAVSSTDFAAILDFMNGHVVDAGFVVEKGETEDHDAEAEWDGSGFRGRWSIRESAACPGDTVVQVLSAAD